MLASLRVEWTWVLKKEKVCMTEQGRAIVKVTCRSDVVGQVAARLAEKLNAPVRIESPDPAVDTRREITIATDHPYSEDQEAFFRQSGFIEIPLYPGVLTWAVLPPERAAWTTNWPGERGEAPYLTCAYCGEVAGLEWLLDGNNEAEKIRFLLGMGCNTCQEEGISPDNLPAYADLYLLRLVCHLLSRLTTNQERLTLLSMLIDGITQILRELLGLPTSWREEDV
jgi:hypothetical protein